MKRKTLCIALVLLLCLTAVMPTFAESSDETPQERASVIISYGLIHLSGSSYRMWASITNPYEVSVKASLAIYDASYNYITSTSTTTSDLVIQLYKNVTLTSGTYHLRITCWEEGHIHSYEKPYTIS